MSPDRILTGAGKELLSFMRYLFLNMVNLLN